MPTIEISQKDLCRLIGKQITGTQLEEDILFAKGEIEGRSGDTLKVDIKDTNRPDLWSAEGIAREIRYRYKGGFPEYKTKRSSLVVRVDNSLEKIRPYTVCAVVKELRLDGVALSQMIQLQEKVSLTFGRNRTEVAIGVYDYDKIKSPITFKAIDRDEVKFVPLEMKKEMTPQEIIENHPKGKEFGHLLGEKKVPLFVDAAGEVLSIPPIINSAHTGKVTEKTKNVFIECSGHNLKFLLPALNVLVTALHERGGKIYTVDVKYGNKKLVTPDLKSKKYEFDISHMNRVSGLGLNNKEIKKLLEKSGYNIKKLGQRVSVLYPAYRQDIMHPWDVVEDVIISYGMNNVEPVVPRLPTKGHLSESEETYDRIAELCAGLGFQEILSYTMTNKSHLFGKMCMKEKEVVDVENPVSSNWSVFRTWLLPGIMEFFSKNMHIEYPQRIFEIGNCIHINQKRETKTEDIRKMCAAISAHTAGYEEISSLLDAFLGSMGVKYELKVVDHPSFIPGRCAAVLAEGKNIGIVGEIHPAILENWRLEKPVAAFEISLKDMLK